MGEWIEYKSKHKGFYDPRTGKKLNSIKGLKNRPKIDPFMAYPTGYLDITEDKIIEMRERKHKVLINLNVSDIDASSIVTSSKKDLKANV